MKNYAQLLRHPGVARVLFSQLLARFPYGIVSIAFVIQVQHTYHSYALAGLVLGAETIGVGISGPLVGRMLGHFGARKVLTFCSLASSAMVLTIAFVHLPEFLVLVAATLAGLLSPPVQSAARTTYPSLLEAEKHTLIFGLDATLQEIIWIIGPVIATLLASAIAPEAGMVAIAVILIGGVMWFLSNKEVAQTKFEKPNSKFGKVLKNRIVIVTSILGFLIVGSFAGFEIGVVGIFTKDRALAGIIIAMFSVGSIIGGLVFSQLRPRKHSFALYSTILALGFALTFIAPTNAIWMSFCFIIGGLGVAPFLGMLGAVISFVLSKSQTAEAYGWLATGQMVGYSAAAAITGFAIDTFSPVAALFVALAFAILTSVVAFATIKITPVLPSHHEKEKR